MKIFLKSLVIKRGYSKSDDKKCEDSIPHLKFESKDSKVDLVELNGILDKANEISVEWETCRDRLVISRIVCRTVVWLAVVALLWYVAAKFIK